MREFSYQMCRGQAVVTPEHTIVAVMTGIRCDPDTGSISLFTVAPGKNAVSPMDVVGWDDHHLIVRNEDAVGPLEEFMRAGAHASRGDLIGKKVRTRKGIEIGVVCDFAIDPRSMRWTKLDVVQKWFIFVKKRFLIPRHLVIEIRDTEVIIEDPSALARPRARATFKKQALTSEAA